MSKYTQGPWEVHAIGKQLYVETDAPIFICDMQLDAASEKYVERVKADARLIAAAPELLEALQWIADALRDSPDFKDYATTSDGVQFHPLSKARTAIARATGEGV